MGDPWYPVALQQGAPIAGGSECVRTLCGAQPGQAGHDATAKRQLPQRRKYGNETERQQHYWHKNGWLANAAKPNECIKG